MSTFSSMDISSQETKRQGFPFFDNSSPENRSQLLSTSRISFYQAEPQPEAESAFVLPSEEEYSETLKYMARQEAPLDSLTLHSWATLHNGPLRTISSFYCKDLSGH